MIPGLPVATVAANRAPKTAIGIIQRLGLSSDLVLCLDAGDAASYPGGGAQQWSDVSGEGNHYNRGTSSGSQSTDPTFNGTAGGLSSNEYFSLDGGDFFTPVAATTFANGWHKDNATWTMAFVVWLPVTPSGSNEYFAANTTFGGGDQGISIARQNGNIEMFVDNGNKFNSWGSTDPLEGAWSVILLAVDEAGGAGASYWNINGGVTAFNGVYSAPESSDPADNLTLGGLANNSGHMASDTRFAAICAWDRALSQTESGNLIVQIGKRFGI